MMNFVFKNEEFCIKNDECGSSEVQGPHCKREGYCYAGWFRDGSAGKIDIHASHFLIHQAPACSTDPLTIVMAVQVLNSNHWPINQNCTLSLPKVRTHEIYQSPACIYKAERDLSIAGMYIHLTDICVQVLIPALELFGSFYAETHQSRRLSWVHSQGQCAMTVELRKKKHELTISTYQACILLHFNASRTVAMKDLIDGLCLTKNDLEKAGE